jgi:16S rRNA (cytosine1402-N4)-methyltransferase
MLSHRFWQIHRFSWMWIDERNVVEKTTQHVTVLETEVIEAIEPSIERVGLAADPCIIVDCTLGGGGHSAAILTRFPAALVCGIDRDAAAVERANARLRGFAPRFIGLCGSFGDLDRLVSFFAGQLGLPVSKFRISAAVMDLGLSTDQLNDPERGFSFQRPAPLDMRFSTSQSLTASEILNSWSKRDIARVFQAGGVGIASRNLAHAVVAKRPFNDTSEFQKLCSSVLKPFVSRPGHDPATVPFQALRMAVNDELAIIESGMNSVHDLLGPRGRLAVISFHSLEDQVVTRLMRKWSRAPLGRRGLPVTEAEGTLITPSAVRPSTEEVAANRRSRSAMLRVWEKAERAEAHS